jgi:hypothetical protein
MPESESRSKPRVEILQKTDEAILKIMAACGVSVRFWRVRKEDLRPPIWKQVKDFLERDSLFLHGPPGVGNYAK